MLSKLDYTRQILKQLPADECPSEEDALSMWWQDIRPDGGLRLSAEGCVLFDRLKIKGYEFEVLANVHVEPIGLYSEKIKTIEELKDGALIAIPDNPSNEYRALVLLEANGLIKLKEGIQNFSATPADILENPRNFQFIEVDAGQLTRSLPDVDVAVINTNRILEAGIDPKTALVRENSDSPYGNIVVVRNGDETRPELIKLKEALLSPEVKQFIIETYGVAVVPAF